MTAARKMVLADIVGPPPLPIICMSRWDYYCLPEYSRTFPTRKILGMMWRQRGNFGQVNDGSAVTIGQYIDIGRDVQVLAVRWFRPIVSRAMVAADIGWPE